MPKDKIIYRYLSEILPVQFLTFILVYPIIWMLSILPMRVLHFISSCAYYLLFYIVGYRKKVVYGNLGLAFPEKSEGEIHKIAKTFYKHFTDVFIEMIKSFTVSKKEIHKRYQFKNVELLHRLEKAGKSTILLGAHYANWEWMFSLNSQVGFDGFGIYKKLKNPYFDKKVRSTRGRFNTTLVPTKEIFDVIKTNKQNKLLSIYGFLGDQSPKPQKAHHWPIFLGVQVPAYTGVELLAKKHDLAIVFFKTKRIKRSYYECTLELLTDRADQYPDYEITDKFLKKVESQIREAPEYYLWTHKRFKHKDKAPKPSKD